MEIPEIFLSPRIKFKENEILEEIPLLQRIKFKRNKLVVFRTIKCGLGVALSAALLLVSTVLVLQYEFTTANSILVTRSPDNLSSSVTQHSWVARNFELTLPPAQSSNPEDNVGTTVQTLQRDPIHKGTPLAATVSPTMQSAARSSEGDECIYELNLGYTYGKPDGTQKMMLNFNGQFPGPTLTCERGKFLVVRVNNFIDEPTTIHWHGIEQHLSPFNDGPESITQCSIVPGTSMTYRFKLFQSGTYWYHSHHSYQYVDGAWGALIIANEKPFGEVWRDFYDDEIIISLSDWYHRSAKELGDGLMNGTISYPLPDSILINGLGSSTCNTLTENDRDCYPNLIEQKPAVINVTPGRRYRIRVINASATSSFNFSIDGHKLQAIETDGVDTILVPLVDAVQIWGAQRYSFLLNRNGTRNEYWIRAAGDYGTARGLAVLKYTRTLSRPSGLAGKPPALVTFNKAVQGRPHSQNFDWNSILSNKQLLQTLSNATFLLKPATSTISNMEDSSITLPITLPLRSPEVLNQDNCHPYHKDADSSNAPGYYDRLITINATKCTQVDDGKPDYCLNGVQFVPGSTGSLPALFQLIRGEPITNGGAILETPYMNEVVQLVINNQASGNHPWHLHGHTFWVVGTGEPDQGDYNATRDEDKLILNGVRRDTTHSWSNSWVVLRYHTGNPGVWLFHCHIAWHFAAGFGGVVVEASELAQQLYSPIPQEAYEVCRRAGVEIL